MIIIRDVQNQTNFLLKKYNFKQIQYKNRKPNQPESKSQKTTFGLDAFRSFFYSTA